LPLGHIGEAELMDVWLESAMSVEGFARALVPVLPGGLAISQVCRVSLKEPALQTRVVSAEYRVTVDWKESAGEVEARVERVLTATELPRERRGRRYDLRPLIERLWLEQAGGEEVVLGMQLATRPGATARPEAVLGALGMDGAFARYRRRRLLLTDVSDS
jgi:radical SAM-linked protein